MRKTWIVLILLVFLVVACLPAQSPEQIQAQIETSVAQTVAAQKQIEDAVAMTVAAQNAQATSTETATPTNTPLSFPTLTPIVFTVTPLPPPSSGGGGGGGSVGKADYACDIIHQRPYDNSEFNPGDDFDVKWTILNTGTKTWDPGVDVKYLSGPQMTSVTFVEIPVAMKPNDQYDIRLDAAAPTQKGFQVMTWIVQGQYCYPYVAIIVK
jgi:hypothetical protein